MNFKQTILEMESISSGLKKKGVTVEELDKAIGSLKEHSDNIENIEKNIEAIKSEVISPIKTELDQNKAAGRFSIFGFWVGAIGLLVSIGTIIYQQSSIVQNALPVSSNVLPVDNRIVERLRLIENQLLFPQNLTVKNREFFVPRGAETVIASGNDTKIILKVELVIDFPKGEGLKGGIKIFKGKRLLGRKALESVLIRSDGKTSFRDWYSSDQIAVDVGDTLVIGVAELTVVRFETTSARERLIGDEREGIVFRLKQRTK